VSKTQFVEFGNHGFWAYDVALGVFLKHLIDATEVSGQSDTTWLVSAVSSWRSVACISDFGLTLDKDWSVAQRQEFVALAEAANASLASRESIPAAEIARWQLLDDLRVFPRSATELFTAPIIELGHAIIALVSGRLPEAPEGETWLYGTSNGRETLKHHR
jgi:hypothetical protein